MKKYSIIPAVVVFIFCACNNKQEPSAGYSGPKVVEAKGYVVPSDSMPNHRLPDWSSSAHEIQNPLNFVNNFSEVNSELVDELEQEVQKGNLDGIKSIAKDIKENEQKIIHHGGVYY